MNATSRQVKKVLGWRSQDDLSRSDPRLRVEHCLLTVVEIVRKMAQFGIIGAVQPGFPYPLSHYYRTALGARTDSGTPIRTWFQSR